MTFDPHSLERLRQLGRQLPKELPEPNISSLNSPQKTKKLHPQKS